jgi:CRISPR-associated protein Cas1
MPARDDVLPLYIQEQGAMLGKSGDVLTVKKSGKLVQEVRRKDVAQVSLFGNVMVSAQALRELAADGVPICHFSYGGWFCALTSGLIHKNVELRTAQFAVAADPRRSLEQDQKLPDAAPPTPQRGFAHGPRRSLGPC